jgi:hypothetical protein
VGSDVLIPDAPVIFHDEQVVDGVLLDAGKTRVQTMCGKRRQSRGRPWRSPVGLQMTVTFVPLHGCRMAKNHVLEVGDHHSSSYIKGINERITVHDTLARWTQTLDLKNNVDKTGGRGLIWRNFLEGNEGERYGARGDALRLLWYGLGERSGGCMPIYGIRCTEQFWTIKSTKMGYEFPEQIPHWIWNNFRVYAKDKRSHHWLEIWGGEIEP